MSEVEIELVDAIPHPRTGRGAMVSHVSCPRDGELRYEPHGLAIVADGVRTVVPWNNVRCVRMPHGGRIEPQAMHSQQQPQREGKRRR
jgi:hypothetical protein